jgi:hypothetical protein
MFLGSTSGSSVVSTGVFWGQVRSVECWQGQVFWPSILELLWCWCGACMQQTPASFLQRCCMQPAAAVGCSLCRPGRSVLESMLCMR